MTQGRYLDLRPIGFIAWGGYQPGVTIRALGWVMNAKPTVSEMFSQREGIIPTLRAFGWSCSVRRVD